MCGDMTDEEWAIIKPLLPAEHGRGRPARDNRRFLNGMLYVLRVGCSWRDMHKRYGNWNSIYTRFRGWADHGVWDALLPSLVNLGLTDDWQHRISGTNSHGHSQTVGVKKELIRTILIEAAVNLQRGNSLKRSVKDTMSIWR